MIKYNNTNNASTTLTAWISPSSTTLIVENGDILPAVPFLLTLEHFDNEKVTVREIVKCIAKVGTILTIQRGAWTCWPRILWYWHGVCAGRDQNAGRMEECISLE